MLQSGMTGTWAVIELGRGKAQLAKSKEASIYDSAQLFPVPASPRRKKAALLVPPPLTHKTIHVAGILS